MRELFRSNDPVAISWAEALLAGAGIRAVVLDRHTSVLEGSIGVLPRRIMVPADRLAEARALVEAEGKGALLPAERRPG